MILKRSSHFIELLLVLTLLLNISVEAICPLPGTSISEIGFDLDIGFSEPQIGIDDAGNAIAVWSKTDFTEGPSGITYIQYATLSQGESWSSPGMITSFPQDNVSSAPQIAVSRISGNAVAIWVELNAGVYYLRASERPFAGNWSSVVDVASSTERILFPEISINNSGYAVAVWQQNTGSNIYLKSANFIFGSGWSAPIVVVSTTGNMRLQKVAVDPAGVAYAVWIDNVVNSVQASTLPMGGAWAIPENLAPLAYLGPDVAVGSAGFAVATWSSLVGSDFYTQVSIYQSGWTTPISISSTIGVTTSNPNVAIDSSNNVSVVWEEQMGFDQVIKSAYRPIITGSWGSPQDVSPLGFSYRPQVAFDSNENTYAVWTSGSRVIEFAIATAGGVWTSPPCSLLSPSSDLSDFSHVVAALDGYAVIIWLNTTQNAIQATTYPPSPPTITSVIPASGSVSGGNMVLINGSNFYDAIVEFGEETFAANVTLISPSQLVVIVPKGVLGVVDVIVTTPSGVATLSQSYTYIPPICWQR